MRILILILACLAGQIEETKLLTAEQVRALELRHDEMERRIAEINGRISAAKSRGLPTEQLEQELSAAEKELFEFTRVKDDDPLFPFLTQIDEVHTAIRRLRKASPTPEEARQLTSFLELDLGLGRANHRVRMQALKTIEEMCYSPAISASARRVFRDSLLDYRTKGGGSAEPRSMMMLAEALLLASDQGDREAESESAALAEQALAWNKRLGFHAESELWEERLAHLREYRPANVTSNDERQAFNLIFAVGKYTDVEVAYLDEAAQAALSEKLPPEVRGRLLSHLLRTYRRILKGPEGKRRDVRDCLDQRVLLIAQQQKLTDEQWRLWEGVVTLLRPYTPETRRFIEEHKHEDTERGKRCRRLLR